LNQIVHPAFRGKLEAATLPFEREGELGGEGVEAYTRSQSSLTLSITVAGNPALITAARYQGAADDLMRRACEIYCRTIERMPLQEVAEHSVLYLIDLLRDPKVPPPVPGILTARNCGPPFSILAELIRSLFQDCLARREQIPGYNAWNPRLHEDWLSRSRSAKIALVNEAITRCLAEARAASVLVRDIEAHRRVVIGFTADFPTQDKPALLMRLERDIRQMTGSRIEIYAEEKSDGNELRRLSGDDGLQPEG
jgi:hypothetical protein